MKKTIFILAICFLLVGCGSETMKVHKITPEVAKEMMQKDVVILDVRTKTEYEKEHIENAINIPLDSIRDGNSRLPEKDTTILVYCASGNRSQQAATKLIDLGYQNVYDFGGIIDWPYETIQE